MGLRAALVLHQYSMRTRLPCWPWRIRNIEFYAAHSFENASGASIGHEYAGGTADAVIAARESLESLRAENGLTLLVGEKPARIAAAQLPIIPRLSKPGLVARPDSANVHNALKDAADILAQRDSDNKVAPAATLSTQPPVTDPHAQRNDERGADQGCDYPKNLFHAPIFLRMCRKVLSFFSPAVAGSA